MKCDVCKEKIETIFLEKIVGTYVRVNSKKKLVCNNCQKKYPIQEIREKLK